MGFLRRLMGRGATAPATWPAAPGPIIAWPRSDELTARVQAVMFEPLARARVNVVGESAHQGTLERFAGGRTIDGARNPDQMAVLLPEPHNPYDDQAVRVLLFSGSEGGVVGHLSREDARWFRPVIDRVATMGKVVACRAALQGGWDRGPGDRGSIGVVLHLRPPTDLMGELDRDVGPDPAFPPSAQVEAEDRSYNRNDCPYCGVVMHPLPKAKKVCPSCGRPVYVRSGPDKIRHLLREDDLPAMLARWDDHYQRRADDEDAANNQLAAVVSMEGLASYAEAGADFVDMAEALPDSCAACRAVAGRRFSINQAPRIPVQGCTNRVCRCDYLPVVGGS